MFLCLPDYRHQTCFFYIEKIVHSRPQRRSMRHASICLSALPDALLGGNSPFWMGKREPGGATVAPLAAGSGDGDVVDLSQMASTFT